MVNYLAKAINHYSRLGPDKGGFRSNLVWWRLNLYVVEWD